ncbi:Antilisterial bacteriocin subtilosin biosynthesis protein AlbA [Pirellulimonas nuda]|uniref:Antilisterial bacteriocin subtilosin biosynthesis protein AlbA n=1 Tax=Pirellulimonas nuda TaxID=2528009 RepID=A0A518D762_9BACT|nr:radical SAM protein [Pirellulimonas nuda]QDU87320.1 Antilisterial bacteriocin subtilosin biosynthesis protein AlbA [Pirellulimonas nuda]
MLPFRDYTYLGATQSVCPDCLALTPAKIIERGGRVYFRKRCPTHGLREDFVCSDARWFDRPGYTTPARQPLVMATLPERGCPFDCGLCTEHEQHTCVALLEITSSCNLECPMCFAGSAPGGKHLTLEECQAAIDALVEAEGQPEVLQLSGGEPTIHPRFFEIVDYACGQPIDYVMINTNGVRLARDPAFVARLAQYKHKLEVYLQFDSTEESAYVRLRGEPLLAVKQQAVENCAAAGLRLTLVATLQAGVNLDQVGPIVRYAAAQPMVSGVSFQPASYVGRHFLPQELEERVTFPDVLQELARQWPEVWRGADFTPLPCAHPNAHTIAYAYRAGQTITPLARFIDIDANLGLLAGGITFTRPRARALIEQVMSRSCCGPGGCGPSAAGPAPANGLLNILDKPTAGRSTDTIAAEFFAKAIAEDLTPSDTFRVTITSFMDAYNFDVRQVMKSCVHFVLPSGHIVPFSAYNLFYRDGHVPLPPLTKGLPRSHGAHRERKETELETADDRR